MTNQSSFTFTLVSLSQTNNQEIILVYKEKNIQGPAQITPLFYYKNFYYKIISM